ncbi:hypothetical protein DPMN_111592 [Dreissena polymorpha]|uniref:Uncharacterized protein n=1 Tax=Dreissena polymorpha TaxID=45954 RepID=A0A9D4QP55_DREPO|nr:hypothetical protein DPMN_111592 [Dreissena polymorpha]
MTALRQQIWEEKKWSKEWPKLLVIPLPKKRQTKIVQELTQHQSYQSFKQSHATYNPYLIQQYGLEHGKRAGWIQSWAKHSGTDLQLQNHL